MAQHDYVIANASGATVRADINSALSAIQTLNSGTSEPSSTAAGMLWLDTTGGAPYALKVRDAGNNHWLTIGSVTDPGSDGNLELLPGKINLPSSGGIYESDGSTEILTELSGAVSLKNTTIDSTAIFPSGHIIQTENVATTSTFTPGSITGGTFVDSGFSDTITPKRTDSKLLVNFNGTVSSSANVWVFIAVQFSGSSITTQTVGEDVTTPLIRTNPRGTGDLLWISSFTVLKDVNQSNNTDPITVKIRVGVHSTAAVTLGERQTFGEELMTTMTIQEVMP